MSVKAKLIVMKHAPSSSPFTKGKKKTNEGKAGMGKGKVKKGY